MMYGADVHMGSEESTIKEVGRGSNDVRGWDMGSEGAH